MKKVHKLFFSAGEASGDILASNLISSLKQNPKYHFNFFGIAGPKMMKTGQMTSIFSIQDLSITGYLEILPKILKILFRLIQTIISIRNTHPDLIITVDSPGFNFLLVTLIKNFLKMKIPIIHYIAPTVWAYNPERAKKCAELFDHMLVIFPFEKKFFDKVKLHCTYIGNPTIENVDNFDTLKKKNIKAKYNLTGQKIITIIPGSRNNELKYHLPVLKKYMIELNKKYQKIHFIIPTLPHLEGTILKTLNFYNLIIIKNNIQTNNLINISDLILCKSGTSVLQSIAKKIPILVFYKMNKVTAYLIKKKLQIKYVTICNIMMRKTIIPELLQENFNLYNLLRETDYLMKDKDRIAEQLENFDIFLSKFSTFKNQKLYSVIDKVFSIQGN